MDGRRRWTCRWARSSFGLNPETAKEYIYEEIFNLTYYCHIAYDEAWHLPIPVRKWWFKRVTTENEKKAAAQNPQANPTPKKPVNWDALNSKIGTPKPDR